LHGSVAEVLTGQGRIVRRSAEPFGEVEQVAGVQPARDAGVVLAVLVARTASPTGVRRSAAASANDQIRPPLAASTAITLAVWFS
jgi:hypothetical protein